MNEIMTKKSLYIGSVIALNIALLTVFSAPFLSFAGTDEIYVDAGASGDEDGSSKHPYKTISKAIKKADKGDKIFVAKGRYKENIILEDKIKIFGSSRDGVILEAKDKKRPVVTMDDDTEINKMTIRKGRIGVEVRKDDNDVSIVECLIEDNDRDGIRIEAGSTHKSDAVNITNSVIKDNGWNGIYSQKKRVVIIDSTIEDNAKDGIELESGSSSWMEGNKIKDNGGVGMKLYMDGSNIWTKSNTIRDNAKSGIEVKSFGSNGRIDISKSKIFDNNAYAAVRIQHAHQNSSVWNGLTFDNRNEIYGNLLGGISHVMRVN